MGWAARRNMETTNGLGRSEEDPSSYAFRLRMKVARAAARKESREAAPTIQPVLQGVAKALAPRTYDGIRTFGNAKEESCGE